MSVVLQRGATLQDIQIELCAALDGQGMPSYASPVVVQGRVVYKQELTRLAVGARLTPEESERIVALLWIDAGAALLPELAARITTANGTVGLVGDVKRARAIDGTLDHVRVTLERN